MKNSLVRLMIATGLFLTGFLVVSKAVADTGCLPLYGGGVTCPPRGEILIDKQVKKATEDIFVDNLTQFDPKYQPEQEVVFRILIRNTSGETIDEIEVKDLLPDFVSFVSGPGSFNQNEGKNGTLTFKINNLAPSETREYWVRTKVFSAASLPENLICKLQNRAQARASGDRFSEDIAEFCIEKKALAAVTQIPITGVEGALFSLVALSGVFAAGLVLRQKAKEIINK